MAHPVGFLLLPALLFLLLSGLTDSRWGSGVRGALSGVSGSAGQSVRDRLSAGVSGARGGWRDKAADTPQTPRQDNPLTRLRDKLSGAVRGVREEAPATRTGGVRRQLSGLKERARSGWRNPRPDSGRTQLMIRGQDGRSRYVDHLTDQAYPDLQPGEELFRVGEHGKTEPLDWTYDDQEQLKPGVCKHCGGSGQHPGQPGGRAVAPDTPCPWCTKDFTVRTELADGTVEYSSWSAGQGLGSPEMYERIGARVYFEDRITGERTEYTRPRPGTGGTNEGDQGMYEVTDQDRAEAEAHGWAPWMGTGLTYQEWAEQNREARQEAGRERARQRHQSGQQGGGNANPGGQAPGAIESLPDYQRYLRAALGTTHGELEDAQAGVGRHQALATSTAEGVARLMALEVDRATTGEGQRVAEAAQIAKEKSQQLAAALADLAEAIKVAEAGSHRHDTAQEVHNAGLLAQKPAYHGA